MKIRPVGAELFHVDGQTERIELTVTFRQILRERLKIRWVFFTAELNLVDFIWIFIKFIRITSWI